MAFCPSSAARPIAKVASTDRRGRWRRRMRRWRRRLAIDDGAAVTLDVLRPASYPFPVQRAAILHAGCAPGFFRWFSSTRRGSQALHARFHSSRGQRPSAAADILSAAWASRSSSGARGGSRRIADFDRTESVHQRPRRDFREACPNLAATNSAAQSTQTPHSSSNWTYRYHSLTTQWSAAAHLQPARRQRAQCKRRLPACEHHDGRAHGRRPRRPRVFR